MSELRLDTPVPFHSTESWQRLIEQFRTRFDQQPDLLVRAPGRVNLIGEHTDYNGYPVLPLAIERQISICAARRSDSQVVACNVQPNFADRRFSLNEAATPFIQGDWGNYIKAAIVGLQPKLIGTACGFNALIDGDIPAAAGLSSSSALVVGMALVFLGVHQQRLDRLALAEILSRAEHYVGTAGGGMDQAISLLGQSGHALKIDFFPLRVQPMVMPAGYKVVICDSLIKAAKTEAALVEYNRRPLECRLATLLLSHYLTRQGQQPVPAQRLADLADHGLTEKEVRLVLGPHPLSLTELAARLQRPVEAVAEPLNLSQLQQPADGFKLLLRYLHVVQEAARVEASCRAMQNHDAVALGCLMNASHTSCRSLYEISTPELDRLVEIARRHGAIGSRLTGAGFGGCTVNLVAEERLESFLSAVGSEYYLDHLAKVRPELVGDKVPADALFATAASQGAEWVDLMTGFER